MKHIIATWALCIVLVGCAATLDPAPVGNPPAITCQYKHDATLTIIFHPPINYHVNEQYDVGVYTIVDVRGEIHQINEHEFLDYVCNEPINTINIRKR